MDIGLILLIAILIGLLPAAIASSKGESFVLWWIFGAALFIVALPAALLLKDSVRSRTCPFCAEAIKSAAIVCPHCQRDLPTPEAAPLGASDDAYWP